MYMSFRHVTQVTSTSFFGIRRRRTDVKMVTDVFCCFFPKKIPHHDSVQFDRKRELLQQ